MTGAVKDPIIPSLVAQFKRGAIVANFGYRDEDNAMQIAGLNSAKRAVQGLDYFGSDGRMALVTLLDDADPAVRVLAAGYLVKIIPDRALGVLQEIEQRHAGEAGMSAYRILRAHKRGELNM